MLSSIVDSDPPDVEERFSAFYRAERIGAARLAWLLTRDSVSCDDVVQDAFTSVYVRFATLDSPKAYLRMAIVNRVKEVGRSAGRERRRIQLVSAGRPLVTDGPTGGLADAIARLPLPQRAAIVLRYYVDLPIEEIAAALDVRPGSVRSMLSRATAILKKELPR